MKEWYKDFIGVYENAFPKEWCDEIITTFQSYPEVRRSELENSPLLSKNDSTIKGDVMKILRKEIFDFFVNKMQDEYLPLYKNKYYNYEEYQIADFRIQKTLPGEGYHLWHYEWSGENINYSKRVLAWTIYLNNIEEGGETEFLHQHLRIPPKTGTLCLFPAYFTHLHRGNPPLKRTKYIVTGWILNK